MITVLGASGFIGSHLVKRLEALGVEYHAPKRDDDLSDRNLADIIYCIGITADFRSRPLETVEAHVCKLLQVVRDFRFDSLLYLSSTRVYDRRYRIATEEKPLQVNPLDKESLYDISKIMGEALVLSSNKNVRVARLSNVYGSDFLSDNFLSSIIKEALSSKKLVLHTSPTSEKDYLSIDDAVDGLIHIATRGKHRVYNLAYGRNTSNEALVNRIRGLTGCHVEFVADAPTMTFPVIGIERMKTEFSFRPANVLDDLDRIVALYQSTREQWDDSNRS